MPISTQELVSSTYPLRTDQPSKLRAAQDALAFTGKHASVDLLVTAISQIGEAIVITDTLATIQYVNPAFTKMTGYSAEEAIGQHTRFLKSDRQDPTYYRKLWQTILAGEVWHGELINRRKDGTHCTEEMSITPVRDLSGAITNFIAIKQDITAHHALEAALANSEQKLENAQRIAPLGSWEIDVATGEVRGSEGFFRIFGYPPGTLQRPLRDLLAALPEGDRGTIQKTLENTVQSRQPFDVEHGVLRPDGTKRLVRSRGQVIDRLRGDPERLCGTSLDITERTRAEKDLRLAQFSLEHASDAIHWMDPHGRIVYANRAACDSLGRSREELLSLSIPDIDPLFPIETWAAFWKELKTLPSMSFETQHQTKQGAVFPVEITATYLNFDGQEYAFAFAHDITERKRAEKDLRLAQFSLEHASDGVFWMNPQGRILYANEAACRSLSRTREELLSLSIPEINPTFPKETWESFWKNLKTRAFVSVETQHATKTGWLFPVEVTATYLEFDGQEYSFAFVRDITERKGAEEDARQSSELLRIVLDSIPEAVYGIDMQGKCTFCNPSCLQLLGYEKVEELLDRNMHDLIHHTRPDGSHYPVEECHIFEAFRQGHGTHIDDEVIWRRDGTSFPAEYWSDPMHRGEEAIGTVVTFVNIAERKRGEQFLLEAKDAAEAANRAKSEFLANMSHEIRTPMNGVIGVAGLLLDTELTAEQRQYAELVRTSGEALMTVINDILDFSKIEARKLMLETNDFDLRTVLENAVELLAIKAAEKGLVLASELKPGTPRLLRGDHGRLRQILVNLLGNAVKFTQKGTVSIWAGLDVEEDESGNDGRAALRFEVSDTGIGFRQEQASALFEPFIQGDGSSTRRYGGTGLGLTISKQLVGLMGGQIGVASQEGKGSTFWFTAVFEKQPAASAPVDANPDAAMQLNPPVRRQPVVAQPKSRARILLAEDNLTNQQVAVAILRKFGYAADVAGNGVEVLDALRKADYDVVLMDCKMPEMDGYEAARQIRDARTGMRNPHIPIIAITADAISGDREKCLESGMNDYLSKPVEPRQLSEILEKWLNMPAVAESCPPGGQSPAEATFNRQELLARLMGDENLARKVVAGFVNDVPAQLRSLQQSIEKGDAAGVRMQSHALKGASATVSAEGLRALCRQVEDAAAANELSCAATLLPPLEEQFELLKTTLKQSGWT